MTPDVIVNSLAIPSRMTMGQPVESDYAKKCAMSKGGLKKKSTFKITREKKKLVKREDGFYQYKHGKIIDIEFENEYNYTAKDTIGDGTAFQDDVLDNILNMMKEYKPEIEGSDIYGKEIMYNGITGEPFQCLIFQGPTYYQRLKHMVDYKIHARARGKKNSLCHQPTEGRSADGGLRVGEMERDCIIGQGASAFLIDRLFENSDKYSCQVCSICGLIAVFNVSTREKYCTACKTSDISTFPIPYATKLLFSELFAMGVVPRIITNKRDE